MSAEAGAVPDPSDVEATRSSLRALVEAIDTGEVEADPQERAYLAGALDTLDRLAGGSQR